MVPNLKKAGQPFWFLFGFLFCSSSLSFSAFFLFISKDFFLSLFIYFFLFLGLSIFLPICSFLSLYFFACFLFPIFTRSFACITPSDDNIRHPGPLNCSALHIIIKALERPATVV
uniref:Uncharacterized protein n=1 Tax=Rhipicephalus pulchellus TaxID=72859 RepID=L7LZ60_RHIPC